MVTLSFTQDDTKLLLEELTKRAIQVENELVHTDKRALQADIARDLRRLERIRDLVANALSEDQAPRSARW